MVTTVLDRPVDLSPDQSDPAPDSQRLEEPIRLHRPPTLFGRTSEWELVEAGHELARQAVAYRAAGVAFDDAAAKLFQPGLRREVLQMARDYLAYTRLGVPLDTQVDALFVLEDVLYRLDRQQQQPGRLVRAWRRVRNSLTRRRARPRHAVALNRPRHCTTGRRHGAPHGGSGRAVLGR